MNYKLISYISQKLIRIFEIIYFLLFFKVFRSLVFLSIYFINPFHSILSEDYFDFSNSYIPSSIEYENKRSICFFNFRNINSNPNFQYLSNGIPSVVSSTLRNIKFTFDETPLPLRIRHEFGINNNKSDSNFNKRDPRYISLQIELIKDTKPYYREESYRLGKEKDCFYIVTGEYEILGSDSLKTTIEITERKNGSFQTFTYQTSLKRAFQELIEKVSDIKTSSIVTGSVAVSIKTGTEINAFIYLDDELLGKSPLLNFQILPGKHRILIIKEGFQRIDTDLIISNISNTTLNFELTKLTTISNLTVVTEPEEADIYWGNIYIGKSPIKEYQVLKGQNRIRISKEGYIDKFIGIDVVDSKPISISEKLLKGDSDTFYKYNNNLFLDYSNFDFGNFSLYGSLVFYGLYMYSGYRESFELDRLNGRATFNSFNFYQGLSGAVSNPNLNGSLFLSSLFYQQRLIDEAWDSTQSYRNIQNFSIGGVITMLSLSGYFYSKGLSAENFEIGFSPSRDKLTGSELNFKAKINF